ncbi:MAG: cyclopropane-fatty-acyl-phospholipid synthase family protein [Halofilum sp. (in: g-proteobacteria)]|nr:cyclopropane-fatty-acyl-phospholipid synthase family protein [Halofilum sp. (in: g-proteobacteria)]
MSTTALPSAAATGPFDRLARRLLHGRLTGLGEGRLHIADADGEATFGIEGDLAARILVHAPRFYRRAATGGALGVAASWIDGDWDCDRLADLFRILIRSRAATGRFDRGGIAGAANAIARLAQRARANTPGGSRRNIRDHYDLGNDFFRLFLDESMTYSAGVFETADASLEAAQTAKLDRICRKLGLRPEHHVLEIGTGWGSFALHAAKHYGCHVTTTTISAEQHALAAARIREAGLEDRITLLQSDYRDLEGQYDRLVSIEMIEAVGREYLETFFRVCSDRLRPDGAMLLQVITTSDREYEAYRRSVDFIQRYVFPGSHCPAPKALFGAIGRVGDLRPVHLEDLSADYAETLRHWRRRFHEAADQVRALGYPERFLRLWDFYLQYCEAGFEERHIGDLQLLLAKPRHTDPAIRPDLRESA